jgi:peptidoglycan/LPS O-acetylase OafA/YrhL
MGHSDKTCQMLHCGNLSRLWISTYRPHFMPINPDERPQFLGRLESLRGLAALCVAIYHSFLWLRIGSERSIFATDLFSVHGKQAFVVRLLLCLVNGGGAVDIFFVLSGFVLAKSLSGQDFSIPNWGTFAIKRVFRIMPALFASIALVLAYLAFIFPGYHTFSTSSQWFEWAYQNPVSIREVFDNLTLQSSSLNSNAWTLSIEMVASLLLPIIVAICWRLNALLNVALLIACFAAGYAGLQDRSWYYFLFLFVIGVNAQCFQHELSILIARVPLWLVGVVCAALMVLPGTVTLMHLPFADLSIGIGSACIIVILASNTSSIRTAWLEAGPVRFIGRVSYSFYLLHVVVLYALAAIALRTIPSLVLESQPAIVMAISAAASIMLALPLAWLVNSTIERPFTKMGKRLAAAGVGRLTGAVRS